MLEKDWDKIEEEFISSLDEDNKSKKCKWERESGTVDDNYFETDCGNDFLIAFDGPKENKMKYCCFCSREIQN